MTQQPPNRSVAVVTGASSGIGEAIAVEYAARGWAVVLAARRVERLQAVAERCRQAGGEALVLPTDVADRQQVETLVQQACDRFGRIDSMVNNAGYGIVARVHETEPEDFRRLFEVNVYGLFYGCRAVAPVMIRQGSGHVFNVSSVIGKRGAPFHGAYSASKFAVCGLSDSMRVELAPCGVHVTAVCPALTETEFPVHMVGRAREGKSGFVSKRRHQSPQVVARKIVRRTGRRTPELVFTLGGKFLALTAAAWPRLADRIMKVYHDALVKEMEEQS